MHNDFTRQPPCKSRRITEAQRGIVTSLPRGPFTPAWNPRTNVMTCFHEGGRKRSTCAAAINPNSQQNPSSHFLFLSSEGWGGRRGGAPNKQKAAARSFIYTERPGSTWLKFRIKKKERNYSPAVSTSTALNAFDLATAAACHCNLIGRWNVWISGLRVLIRCKSFWESQPENLGFHSG